MPLEQGVPEARSISQLLGSYPTTNRALMKASYNLGSLSFAGYIYSQNAILKIKIAKIKCVLRFSIAIIRYF
jgi:hypothetical protein